MADIANRDYADAANASTTADAPQRTTVLHSVVVGFCEAVNAYAAAATGARIIPFTGHGPARDVYPRRFDRASYRPGSWGDPL